MKLPHVNKKPVARKRILAQTPFFLYLKIRAEKFHAAKPLAFLLHFPFRRYQNHYSNLTSKIMKMCEQILKKDSAPPRKRIFVQKPFSHSTLKIERNRFTPQNHSIFRSISCFGVTKITTPI